MSAVQGPCPEIQDYIVHNDVGNFVTPFLRYFCHRGYGAGIQELWCKKMTQNSHQRTQEGRRVDLMALSQLMAFTAHHQNEQKATKTHSSRKQLTLGEKRVALEVGGFDM